MLRIDDAHTFFGLRLNVWTSFVVFALGVGVFVAAGRLGRPGRVEPWSDRDEADKALAEKGEERAGSAPDPDDDATTGGEEAAQTTADS